jgi:hypothetical protein
VRRIAEAASLAGLHALLLFGIVAALVGAWATVAAAARLEQLRLRQTPARGRRALPERETEMDTNPSALPSMVASLLRTLFGFLGGFLVSKGIVSTEQLPEIIGAAMVVVTIVWSWVEKHNANKALKAAIAAPAGKAA